MHSAQLGCSFLVMHRTPAAVIVATRNTKELQSPGVTWSNSGKVPEKTTSQKKANLHTLTILLPNTPFQRNPEKKQNNQQQTKASIPLDTNPAPGSTTDICQETLFANVQNIHVLLRSNSFWLVPVM